MQGCCPGRCLAAAKNKPGMEIKKYRSNFINNLTVLYRK